MDESLKQIHYPDSIEKLNQSIIKLTERIYGNLSAWQCVQVARHPQRPHFFDLVGKICEEFHELHGDRHFGDDKDLIGGLARIGDHRVVLIGHEKGRSVIQL